MLPPCLRRRARRAARPLAAIAGLLGLAGCNGTGLPYQPGQIASAPIHPARTLYTPALLCVGRLIDRHHAPQLVLVPDVVDGDEPSAGTFSGVGPRRLANTMLLSAVANLNTSRVVAANDLAAAKRHAARTSSIDGQQPRIVVVSGGTLAQDDVRSRFADVRGGYLGALGSLGSLGFRRDQGQFFMTLGLLDDQGISMPGHGVELNATITTLHNEARLGISTGYYDFSVGLGTSGTTITRAQAAQALFQAGVMQIASRMAGVDPTSCLTPPSPQRPARAVAAPAAPSTSGWGLGVTPVSPPIPGQRPFRPVSAPPAFCRCY